MPMSRSGAELVMYAARLVRVISRAAELDSPVTLRLLSQLDELGPVSITELARADRTTQPTISTAVRALEERGLVTRTANDQDARSSTLALTPAGRQELDAVRARHAEIFADLVEQHGIEPAAVQQAVDVLRTLTTPTHQNTEQK
jgi:DNA-binding MarR family transcriptional regulator